MGCNNRVGVEGVSKRLDRFLVVKPFINMLGNIRTWVGLKEYLGSFFDLFRYWGGGIRVEVPFKYNSSFSMEVDIQRLVKEMWTPVRLGEEIILIETISVLSTSSHREGSCMGKRVTPQVGRVTCRTRKTTSLDFFWSTGWLEDKQSIVELEQ